MTRRTQDRTITLCSRRDALQWGGAAAVTAALGWAGSARADTYPSKPVRMVVAFPPGGATDILGRLIGQKLSAPLGQQIVVDNRPGAGGLIGLDTAAKSPPDGYTIFLCALTNQAIAHHLYPNASSTISGDFDAVGLVANGAHMLNVHPSVPAKTVAEFVAWLKANNGKVNYASQGNGTLSHLEAELLQQRIGVRLVHVPYKGSSNALPDLLAGNVSFMFDSVAASMTQVKSGKLRALGVAASQRLPAFPDLPTIAEAGVPGYDVNNWFGIFVPKGTPAPVVARLSSELEKVMKDPEVNTSLVQQGYAVSYGGAARLAELTAQEIDKWGKVVKAANIKI